MRLQVFLSHNGVCSRRDAMDLIKSKRVKVNGVVVDEPATPVEGHEKITVDNKLIKPLAYSYIMLNKPVGYTTTKEDVHAAHTVMDILPKNYQHVSPVGRLDRDSSGLLLLTNDGDLAFKLTHPSFHEDKTYEVTLSGEMNEQKIKQLMHGVDIKDEKGVYRTAPCQIKDVVYNAGLTRFTMIIQEGHKRQIRLMAKAVGHHVNKLVRLKMGPLALGDLALGQWRELTEDEIKHIRTNI